MKMTHDYILDNVDSFFENQNLIKKFMHFNNNTHDVDEIIKQNKIEGQKRCFIKNLFLFCEKLLTKHHNRIKQKKLKELLEFTDRKRAYMDKKQYIEAAIEREIKYFKPATEDQ